MGVVTASVDQVSGRWADALFGLAKRTGVLEDVSADIARIARECASPGVERFLCSTQGTSAERVAKLDSLLSSLHATTQDFVRLLFDRRREEVLLQMGTAFEERLMRERGEVRGVVESARALSPEDLASLGRSLSTRVGKTVTLTGRVNPELVGGVRVFVGTRMIDQSVHGRLDGLRRRLMDAPLPPVGA